MLVHQLPTKSIIQHIESVFFFFSSPPQAYGCRFFLDALRCYSEVDRCEPGYFLDSVGASGEDAYNGCLSGSSRALLKYYW